MVVKVVVVWCGGSGGSGEFTSWTFIIICRRDGWTADWRNFIFLLRCQVLDGAAADLAFFGAREKYSTLSEPMGRGAQNKPNKTLIAAPAVAAGAESASASSAIHHSSKQQLPRRLASASSSSSASTESASNLVNSGGGSSSSTDGGSSCYLYGGGGGGGVASPPQSSLGEVAARHCLTQLQTSMI